MTEPRMSIAELLRQDSRYKLEAYAFVFEALRYGHEVLGMGKVKSPAGRGSLEKPAVEKPRLEKATGDKPGSEKRAAEQRSAEAEPPAPAQEDERHLTGQELCEAIRQYALDQYGFMARRVFESWGIHCTGDFGEIVFNLIKVGEMRKTKHDRREDFDNVFDFESGLCGSFQIKPPVERPKPPAG
ncbi:MAG TPA: Minf_1886 family protein [Pirellulales bacterium]|nr:Minf_1886 family protein [Pirellulales bacterium]